MTLASPATATPTSRESPRSPARPSPWQGCACSRLACSICEASAGIQSGATECSSSPRCCGNKRIVLCTFFPSFRARGLPSPSSARARRPCPARIERRQKRRDESMRYLYISRPQPSTCRLPAGRRASRAPTPRAGPGERGRTAPVASCEAAKGGAFRDPTEALGQ
jgi:hypothetical protein